MNVLRHRGLTGRYARRGARARGGLLYWADSAGADRILDMLQPLASLGPRLEPTELLRETAGGARKLYDWHPS